MVAAEEGLTESWGTSGFPESQISYQATSGEISRVVRPQPDSIPQTQDDDAQIQIQFVGIIVGAYCLYPGYPAGASFEGWSDSIAGNIPLQQDSSPHHPKPSLSPQRPLSPKPPLSPIQPLSPHQSTTPVHVVPYVHGELSAHTAPSLLCSLPNTLDCISEVPATGDGSTHSGVPINGIGSDAASRGISFTHYLPLSASS